ncbi:hypothetical protein Hanom_Chr07g00673941 [Helianthus anomalus]
MRWFMIRHMNNLRLKKPIVGEVKGQGLKNPSVQISLAIWLRASPIHIAKRFPLQKDLNGKKQ